MPAAGKKCVVCGEPFRPRRPSHTTCGRPECVGEHARRKKRADNRRYLARHPEKKREYARRHYAADPEPHRVRAALYYAAHREQILARQRRRRNDPPAAQDVRHSTSGAQGG
jgi:hypothetical protein